MQSAGQYGVNEVPQFVVGGSQHPSPHLFSLVHDMSLSPASSGHTHSGHLNHHHQQQQQQHLYSHLNQVQQQQQQQQQSSSKEAPHPHLNLHHHHPHQQQQQTSHSPHQQRQQHQHVQQQQHHQHMQQQVVQQQQVQQQTLQAKHHHHHHQQQVTVQHQQQHMVNEIGLGGPESSEEAAAPGSSVVSRPSPSMYTKQMSAVLARDLALGHEDTSLHGHVDHDEEEHGGIEGGGEEEGLLLRSTQEGSGGNRWPRQETLLLIKIRSEMDSNFRDSGLKGPLWEDVARKLSELGYNRSAKKCKEKFENIHKYYKKTKDGKAGRQDGKNYRFFSELDALYAGRNTSTTHAADATAAAAALMLPGLAAANHDGFMRNAGLSPAAFRAAAENAGGSGFAAVSEGSSEDNDHEEQPEPDLDEHGNNNNNNTSSQKRKRKESETGIPAAARTTTNSGSSSKKVMFLESLVNKLMDQQESMQRKFLESMEKREQERIAREEVWKTQEMERLNREHELRTQEHTLALSRDAALVAVLQKLTGETLQLPPPPSPPRPSSSLHATATTQPARNQNRNHHQQELLLQEEGEKVLHHGSSPFDPHSSNSSSKRWPTPEVHALIRLRMEMESRFQETGPKGPLWEEISTAMASMGYTRNPKRCKEKWENVNKYYRKAKESNKKRAENSKTCPYFQQLDTLYNPAAAAAAATAGAQIAGPRNPASKPADHEQTLEELQSAMPDHLQQEHHLMRDDDDDDDDDDDQSAAKQLVQGDAVQKELGGPLKKTTEL